MILFSLLLASAAFAHETTYDGNWNLESRLCSSGQTPHDPFIIGRDTMRVTISPTDFQSVTVFKGQIFNYKGPIYENPDGVYIISRNDDGTAAILPIRLVGTRLTLTSGGFGVGGSCAHGETLITTFKR